MSQGHVARGDGLLVHLGVNTLGELLGLMSRQRVECALEYVFTYRRLQLNEGLGRLAGGNDLFLGEFDRGGGPVGLFQPRKHRWRVEHCT